MLSFSSPQGFGAENGRFAKGAAGKCGRGAAHAGASLQEWGVPHPWARGHSEPPEAPRFLALAQGSSFDLDFIWTA